MFKLIHANCIESVVALSTLKQIRVLTMIGQAKISSFFRRQHDDSDSARSSNKKLKTDVTTDSQNVVVSTGSQGDSSPTTESQTISLTKQTSGLVVDIGTSWYHALEPEFTKPYFIQLAKFVADERKKNTVYPGPEDVFTWTRMTHIKHVKVVILGQDPYHGPNQAHGLCFSVKKGVSPPPSLENMFKELSEDISHFKHPGHGDLSGWAQQGVLLLNAVLTVREHSANSHKERGWETLTDAVVSWFNKNTTGTIFILWGTYAHKKGANIDKKKHHVLKGVHPSPLSAYRGFFGCKHFSRCNEILQQTGRQQIDWTRLP